MVMDVDVLTALELSQGPFLFLKCDLKGIYYERLVEACD